MGNFTKINHQNETNIHNINKRFFDRTVERLTILLVVLTAVQHLRRKDTFLGFHLPAYPLNMAFMMVNTYRRFETFEKEIWQIGVIAFFIYPVLGLLTKNKKMLLYSIFSCITVVLVLYVNHEYLHLYEGKMNFFSEVRETMFSVLCLYYAYQILSGLKKREL